MGEVEVHALRQVSLTLDEGEFVVLLGRPAPASRRCSTSSAGSTCPTSGQVFYRDTELTRADEAALTTYRRTTSASSSSSTTSFPA